MGPLQQLFAQLMAQQETVGRDPRNVDTREPQSYSDFVRLFGQPPASAQPNMPYREAQQAGPAPPTGKDASEALLFYPGRNVIESPPEVRGKLAGMYSRSQRGQ